MATLSKSMRSEKLKFSVLWILGFDDFPSYKDPKNPKLKKHECFGILFKFCIFVLYFVFVLHFRERGRRKSAKNFVFVSLHHHMT